MIKWFLDKLRIEFDRLGRNFDLDDDKINRVTWKDIVALARFIYSPIILLLGLLLLPIVAILDVLLMAAGLLVAGSAIVAPVALYMIFQGNGDYRVILAAVASILILLIYFVVIPVVKRTSWFQRMHSDSM